jgi:hypothetical protein
VPITAIGGGKRTSPRSDVLGMGIVVLSLLLGRRLLLGLRKRLALWPFLRSSKPIIWLWARGSESLITQGDDCAVAPGFGTRLIG